MKEFVFTSHGVVKAKNIYNAVCKTYGHDVMILIRKHKTGDECYVYDLLGETLDSVANFHD